MEAKHQSEVDFVLEIIGMEFSWPSVKLKKDYNMNESVILI
jgi:hypothetical protein